MEGHSTLLDFTLQKIRGSEGQEKTEELLQTERI